MPAQTTYFEFEVSLDGVEPRIWRRFLLRRNSTFHELHDTIQNACGWWDYHLCEFRRWADGLARHHPGGGIATSPYSEFDSDQEPVPFGHQVQLTSFFRQPGDRGLYYYDFGDAWWHQVELKAIHKLPSQTRRQLLAGERAFPHEDAGGLTGYGECVKAFRMTEVDLLQLEDEERNEVETTRTWLGDWDPERFDFAATAQAMKRRVNY